MNIPEYLNTPAKDIKLGEGLGTNILEQDIISVKTFKRGGYVKFITTFLPVKYYIADGRLEIAGTPQVKKKVTRGRKAKSKLGLTSKRTFRMTPEAIEVLKSLAEKHQVSQPDIITYGLKLVASDVDADRVRILNTELKS